MILGLLGECNGRERARVQWECREGLSKLVSISVPQFCGDWILGRQRTNSEPSILALHSLEDYCGSGPLAQTYIFLLSVSQLPSKVPMNGCIREFVSSPVFPFTLFRKVDTNKLYRVSLIQEERMLAFLGVLLWSAGDTKKRSTQADLRAFCGQGRIITPNT